MPRWYSRLSLRTKISGIALGITTLPLMVVATAGILQIRSQIAAEERRSAEAVALGFGRAVELEMTVGGKADLQQITSSFIRDENILFVAAYDANDKLLASAARDTHLWDAYQNKMVDPEKCIVARRAVEKTISADAVSSDVRAPAAKVAPASSAPRVIGHVVVGLSTTAAVQAELHQNLLIAVITAIAASLGAVILFMTLGQWMRRLALLAEASWAISGGNFSGAINDQHDDEIGRLAKSFDDMRAALRKRDQDLRQFTATLQEQVRDRTRDLQKALHTAEEANRAKSMFLANMSHELRTPLNGVVGMVDLLLAAAPNAQQRRYCDIAKSSARSLLELINDILDFSKIEAGKLELDNTDFDLHRSVEDVTQILGERAQQKGIELLCRVDAAVPRIVGGDPVRLRQVILNLASNAVKFTEKGEVLIDARVEQQNEQFTEVRISVRDSGIGIPKDRLDRLFKSFSQVDASTTRKFGGTGLGLAISQRITEMMGGRIGVTSELGKGSTFWFTARLARRSQVSAPRKESAADPRGVRVLAVDDNQTNREILQSQLLSWKLRADIAVDAEQALSMLKAACDAGDPYRFALLDMHMPRTDGMMLAATIKNDPRICSVILISLSSISDQIRREQMAGTGFAACLTKPVLPSQLYDTIVTALAARETDHTALGEPSSENDRLDGVRVLLAEDNEVNRLVATELLELFGCVVSSALNGQEAIDAALSGEHDIILMDCQMPILDGFEATRRIRAAEATAGKDQHRKIVALTANAIKGDRELCFAAGMDEYLTKPIEPKDLMKTIRSLLPKQRIEEVNFAKPDLAAGQSASGQAAPVDLDSLQRRCVNNRKLAAKALRLFDGNIDQDLAALGQGIAQRDAKAVAAAAHRIKGAAANISAEPVRRTAAELERLGRAELLDQTQVVLDELARQVAGFREFLETAMAGLAVPPETATQGS